MQLTRYILFIAILFVGCKDSQQKRTASPKKDVASVSFSGRDSGYYIDTRAIPPGNIDVLNFLESLKWKENSDSSGYDIKRTPRWSISLLMDNISDNGVLFIDPNDNFDKTITKQNIEKQLSKRKGKCYEMISHFAYIYSMPYKQYSEIKFKENQKKETTVDIGSWYELTFESKQNRHYLIKCEYLELESE
jgi:hypothetical protein